MRTPTAFVVSDDAAVRESVKELVESAGLHAEVFPSLQAFLDAVGPGHRGCLVLDTHSGDLSNQSTRARVAAACARMAVLLLTDRGNVPMAVRPLKAGAMDVVEKPYRDKNLLDLIKGALEAHAAGHT